MGGQNRNCLKFLMPLLRQTNQSRATGNGRPFDLKFLSLRATRFAGSEAISKLSRELLTCTERKYGDVGYRLLAMTGNS
jgi:hypothetical protein